jgi:putative membrane protein
VIIYNPKDWLKLIFHKSDTLRKLFPLMLVMAVYSALVAYWELEWVKLEERSWLRNVNVLHSLLGFAISMLLVFRTNTAYDRWWEGRKQWGTLVNTSRNLALKLNAILPDGNRSDRLFFRKTIPLYASLLTHHLQSEVTRLMLDEKEHPELKGVDTQKHVPNQIAAMLMQRVQEMYRAGKITGDQLIILNNELAAFTDICGACERIKNTPIPFSYSAFIKKFVLLYVITLPFGYSYSVGYLIIPIVMFVFFVLASLELVAEEIEDPFGYDENDLPMQKLSDNIKKHVAEIL